MVSGGFLFGGMGLHVLAMFLIGMVVGRRGYLHDPSRHLGFFRRLLAIGLVVGIPLNIVVLAGYDLRATIAPSPGSVGVQAAIFIGGPALAATYVSGFIVRMQDPVWKRRLHAVFGGVGRTALSNYLFQSMVGTLIFYSYGFEGWRRSFVDALPFINRPDVVRNLGLNLGQEIYTPDDITLANPPDDDRPYAGWLFLGVSFHSRTATRLDVIEFNFGLIGPYSLAEETQSFVHKIFGADRPRGWDHQLKTEPGFLATYERRWRARAWAFGDNFGADFIPHAGVSAGNVAIHGNAGGTVRYGFRLPTDFGANPSRRPSDASLHVGEDGRKGRFGAHVFAGVDGRYVARDIFLDGNTFRDSRSVERKPWVAEFNGGVAMACRDLQVTYAVVYVTRQFETQDRENLFGSLSVTMPF